MNTFIPVANYTQIPNVILDNLPLLKEGELRVMMLMCRETFGWQRPTARLSLSRIQKLTGLSRQGVVTAIENLMERGWIDREDVSQSGYLYHVVVNLVDYSKSGVVNLVDQQVVNHFDHLPLKVVNLVDPSKETSIKEKDKEKRFVSVETEDLLILSLEAQSKANLHD